MGDLNGNGRISVAEALFEKYSECDHRLLQNVCLSPKKAAGHSPHHANRTIISLDRCEINSGGDPGEIVNICPKLEELDLTRNNFKEWKEIFKIVSQLPHLKHLNLSFNPLPNIEDISELCETFSPDSLMSLEHLVLNSTDILLVTVYKLLQCFTGVKELHISSNDYSTVPPSETKFGKVKWISFNKNIITDWKDVEEIGKIFPNLEVLMLTENPIESIIITDPSSSLEKLTTLSLTKSWINDWSSIDCLRKFPSLKDVRLLGIPLADDMSDQLRRQLMIARLPNVTRLNGTLIENTGEREDAERVLIRHHMDDTNPPSRYQELVNIHGLLDKLAEVDLEPQHLVTVQIQFEDGPVTLRKISTKQTVSDLKKSFKSLADGLPPSKIRLMYRQVNTFFQEEMKYPSKYLYSYRIEDGDEILIYRKP